MASHQKSIIQESIERLDGLMAIGESRGAAKERARAAGEKLWGFTTGKIHAYKTRQGYQEHVLNLVNWSRETHCIKRLVDLDARADELTSAYLLLMKEEGKSPYTLQKIRCAFRLFFANRTLADSVALPKRTRVTITRSRGPKKHDRYFQPANWQPLLTFLLATGLRRDEVKRLKVAHILDVHPDTGVPSVYVENGKGGKSRLVEVLPGREEDVLLLKKDRREQELVFPRIPQHLDVHSYRRAFAQALYLYHAPGRTLPPLTGKLRKADYDRDAAKKVTYALGHNRVDVVLNHYLR